MAEKSAATQAALAPVQVKSIAPGDLIEHFNKMYDQIATRAFSIFENDGVVNVQAEVPGFEAKDLEITLEPQRLIISGKRETKEETKQGKTIYNERCSNEIFRTVALPVEVDASKASATLKNGVLELQAPKSAKATTSRVEVKAA